MSVETSPLGDTRQRACPCAVCGRDTYNWSAKCSRCRERLDAQEQAEFEFGYCEADYLTGRA